LGSILLLALCASLLLGTGAVAQTPLTADEAEQLVRRVHFEGMPAEQAERIGPAGGARLIAMLEDPGERAFHANILIALGHCGCEGAFEAIRAWAALPREGELDRATFRAWQALPHALGELAAHDPRALAPLEARLDEPSPGWTFRHHRGARLARLARRSAASSLARTGLPAAGEALDRADRRASDPVFAAHLREQRSVHRRRVEERQLEHERADPRARGRRR
jgi:hypothetical protein